MHNTNAQNNTLKRVQTYPRTNTHIHIHTHAHAHSHKNIYNHSSIYASTLLKFDLFGQEYILLVRLICIYVSECTKISA